MKTLAILAATLILAVCGSYADTTTASLPTPLVLSSADDYVIMPFASARIEPGNYRIRVSVQATPADANSSQVFLKPSFNMAGAPTISVAHVRQVVIAGDGLSYEGGMSEQTIVPTNEQSFTTTGNNVGQCWLILTGTVTVTQAGYLSLAYGGTFDPGMGWTIDSAVVEMTPL